MPEFEQWLHTPDVQRAIEEINGEVHRHAAVMAGALVEDQLKRLTELATRPVLEKRFRNIAYHSLEFQRVQKLL